MLGMVRCIDSFIQVGTILALLGTDTSILRLIPEHFAKYSATSAFRLYRRTQFLVFGVSVAVGCVLLVSSDEVATAVFGKPHLSKYLALAAGFLVFQAIANLSTQAVRGLRLIHVYAVMQLLPAISLAAPSDRSALARLLARRSCLRRIGVESA